MARMQPAEFSREEDGVRAAVIGTSVPRKEGRAKVTGSALYVDDLVFPDMLFGARVRSAMARGRLPEIHFETGIPWAEFTIVTAKDIPSMNCVALLIEDQPCLAEQIVNHPEEPVVLLAHTDKYLLEEARRAVRLEIDPLPGIFTIADSLARKQVIWGEDNIFKSFHVEKGDVDAVWRGADFVVSGQYEWGAHDHLYIEPQGMIAQASPSEGVTVWGSLQCPYYVHKALMRLFGLPKIAYGWCRPKPAAVSAARKNIPRCSPATPRCSRGSPPSP